MNQDFLLGMSRYPSVVFLSPGNLDVNNHKPCGFRCGSRIWSRAGPQLLRPKVADVAKRSHASEVSILRPGSRA